MRTAQKIFLFLVFLYVTGFAQNDFTEDDSVEVYVIDSFIPPDNPNVFNLSFFTSEPAKSKVILDGKYEFKISEQAAESHKIKIDISKLEFKSKYVPFVILVEDSLGNTNPSDKFEFELQKEVQLEGDSNFLLLCLFGGVVFLLPSPVYVVTENDNYFSLTKEIALFTFRGSFKYPSGYVAAEYSHIFDSPYKNFLRLGYKHLVEIPFLEYVSPGINGFTNFRGFNGISPELSIGWIKIFNTFTVYTRYRYNFKPGESGSNFHELSLGLYSGFFSIYF
jgi:hypothetical protein